MGEFACEKVFLSTKKKNRLSHFKTARILYRQVVLERMFYLGKPQQGENYLHGAMILAVAVAIVRILGALFRIPLGRILEDTGMSTFSIASHIYAVLLTLSTAGLPVALSKMISAAAALDSEQEVKRVFTVGRNAFLLIGILSFFVMAFFAAELARFFGSPSSETAILVLSPAVLFVCLISAYRGYCQGFSVMIPTSVSQVIEALSRFVIGLLFAWGLSRRGFSSELTVAGAISGVTVGAFLACVYLFFARRKIEAGVRWSKLVRKSKPRRLICKELMQVAIPLTIGASIFSFIHLLDSAIIMHSLRAILEEQYGQNAEALAYATAQSLHGTYAMTMPLKNLPSSFIIPITVALIPAISAQLARGDKTLAEQTVASSIRITALLSLPAAVGLAVLSAPIMHLLYAGRFAQQGAGLMAIMGISAFFLCLFQVTNSILQAYGFARYTVYTLTIGGMIKLFLTWLLVSNASVSIYGAAVSTLVSYVFICILNIILLKRSIPNPPKLAKLLGKPIFCTGAMGFAAFAVYGLLYGFVGAHMSSQNLQIVISLLGAISISAFLYFVLILFMGALTKEDMQMLPGGKKLANKIFI